MEKIIRNKLSFSSVHLKTTICLFLFMVTLAAYWPAKDHPFINFDDGFYVTDNNHVQKGLTLKNIIWAFTPSNSKTDEKVYWHPLTWLSHMADCQLFGLDPHMHHMSSLFLHILNVILLFMALYKMTGAVWKSAFAALLFALHPINVESVAWISERKNLLSTFFLLLTLLAYIHYSKQPSLYRYLIVFIAMAAGLMAKPMLVTLPFALLLFDFWPLYRLNWGQIAKAATLKNGMSPRPTFQKTKASFLVLEKIPLLLLSIPAIWLSVETLRAKTQMLDKAVHPMLLRIENAVVSYVAYLGKMIWPENLAVFYPFPDHIPAWEVIASAVFIIGTTTWTLARSKKSPYLPVGWLWYLGTLMPVIGIIQGGLWPQLADRWAYVPFIGIFIIIAWGGTEFSKKLFSRHILLPISATVILFLLIATTRIQLSYWSDSFKLFKHTDDITENNYIAQSNMGSYLAEKGKKTEAIKCFLKAIEIMPTYAMPMKSLGALFTEKKDYKRALKYYSDALMISPEDGELMAQTAALLLTLGRTKEAMTYYNDAMAVEPSNAKIHIIIGNALFRTGQFAQAEKEYKTALRFKPGYAEVYYCLGMSAAKTGNQNKAINYYLKAIRCNPDYADAHKSLADAMFQKGDLMQALGQYKKALQANPDDAKTHYNIGVILYMQNRVEKAASHFKKALKIDPGYEKAKNGLMQISRNR